MANLDRKSYDTGVSSQVQGDVQKLMGLIESIISAHRGEVSKALADFQADGVSAEYSDVEKKWGSAADETLSIIAMVRKTLEQNDQTAGATMKRASAHVQQMC